MQLPNQSNIPFGPWPIREPAGVFMVKPGRTIHTANNRVVLNELESLPPSILDTDQTSKFPEFINLPEPVCTSGESLNVLEDEEVLKKAKQGVGRTSKLKSLESLELDCAKPGQVKKKRGRKPKSEAGPSILRETLEGSGGVDPCFVDLQATAARNGADKYFTRATKAWILGKSAGLVFPGSDAEAIKGLAKELEEDQPVP